MQRIFYSTLFAISLLGAFIAGILHAVYPVAALICAIGAISVLIFGIILIGRAWGHRNKVNEDFYSEIVRNADVGLYRADLNGKCLFTNDCFENLFKHFKNLSKNKEQGIIVPFCEDSEKRKAFMDQLLSGGEVQGFESSFYGADEQIIHIAEDAKLLFDLNGTPSSFVGVVKNISDIKKIEKELALEKRYLTAVMDNSSESVFIEDFEGKFLKVNRVFADYAGVDNPDLCVGSNVYNYLSPQLSAALLDDISNVVLTGEDSSFMLSADDSQGNGLNLVVQHSLFRNSEGEPAAIIGYARKVESKVESVSDIPFCLSNLCHELRTPFVGIIGSLKALNDEDLPQSAKPYALKALKSAERFKDALNGFLHDFSGEESVVSGNNYFNPATVFSKILDIYIPAVELEGKSLELVVNKNIPEKFLGKCQKLSQALFGLIGNGLSLMEGTKLVAGIDMQNIAVNKAIFSFFVTDSLSGSIEFSDNQLSNGFKDAVNKIEGEIYSQLDNNFTIGFKVETGFIVGSADEVESFASIKKSILLAEDDISSQFMMRKKLEKWGYTVRTASTGIEVLTCLKDRAYDLVLMDIQMPEMDGFEAIKTIRDNESGKERVPIVVLSAYGADINTEQMALLGINEFISKPIRMEVLKDIVSKYLN
ncbi:response regulator [Maridesulfovibrio ferrireducens]|uniref:response regulator n=1 Tax=Maridesulfovibrio ferrireducens TaxID=246191 RepID=UPI001A31FEB7|nr:response regulator [Maridesulfovibrio ferrireducens]MBI9110794.1 response regulator [Maridesulfovibrio ferrireducens]